MINISTEGGLFQRVERWQDVLEMPGSVPDVDASAAQLKRIIGNYDFDTPVACGLSGCRQPHGKGYIVQLVDGRKTNLGKDCGRKYFGTEFQFARRRFDSDRRDQENRLALCEFQNRLPRLRERVKDLRQGQFGGDWAYRALQKLKQRGHVPDAIVTEVGKFIRSRDAHVMRDRSATSEEIQQLETAAGGNRHFPRPYYVQEPVGVLEGLPALYSENDLRDLLIKSITGDLDQVEGQDMPNLRSIELAALAKRVIDIDTRFDKAEQALVDARKLLHQKNLRLLNARLADSKDRAKFGEFIRSMPE